MGVFIVILVVLAVGIWLGFIIGFSRAMREVVARMRGPKRRATAWFLIAGACVCFVVAVSTSLYSWYFVSTALRTTGTITELRERTEKEHGGIAYAPIYKFRDAAGAEHSVASNLYSAPPLHRVGDTVQVLYHPTDPVNARIDGYWYLWGIPTVTGLLSGLYLPLGLIVFFWPRIIGRFGGQRA